MMPEMGDFTDYGFADAGSYVTILAEDETEVAPKDTLSLQEL